MRNADRFCFLVCLVAIWTTPMSTAGAGREHTETEPDVLVKKFAERDRVNTTGTRKREKEVRQDVSSPLANTRMPLGHAGRCFVSARRAHRMTNQMNGLGSPLLL